MWFPREHRLLVQQLLTDYKGDEVKLRNALVHLGLDALAAARRVDLARVTGGDDDSDDIPSIEDIIADVGASVGLGIRDLIPGKPASAVIYATKGPVVVGGDDEETRVIVRETGERAIIRSLTARGASSGAVFTVSPRELRMRDRFAPEGHALLIFVLRAEGRAWIMTRAEVLQVYEALEVGRKVERFSLAADGALRVSMPKKPTGLDMAFPRVSLWNGDA